MNTHDLYLDRFYKHFGAVTGSLTWAEFQAVQAEADRAFRNGALELLHQLQLVMLLPFAWAQEV